MRFFTHFSLRNPVAVVILVLLIAVGGILSSLQLKEELMPNISVPIVSVVTTYPGATPQQVATDITAPLEKALNGAKDVQDVTSTSLANVSQIELQLSMSADINTVEQNVTQLVNQVVLPSSAGKPSVQSFSFSNQPILEFTVASAKASSDQLKNTVNNTVLPALQGIAGVATVKADGADPSVVNIQFNQAQLNHYHLSLQQVLQDLQSDNMDAPLGSATVDGKVQPVQMRGKFNTLQEIKDVPIPLPGNSTAAVQAIGGQLGQMGKAVGQVANSVGQLGQGMNQLGQGVGQLGQGLALTQVETRLLASLQQIQGQLFGAELQLSQQLALPQQSQDKATIARLQQTILALEKTQSQVQSQLTQLQAKAGASTGGIGSSGPGSTGATTGKIQPGASQAPASSVQAGSSAVSSIPATNSQSSSTQTIPLSKLASVSIQPPANSSIDRTNGQPSILVTVAKTENANTVSVAAAINDKLATLKSQLPTGVQIVPLYDSSTMVKASVNGMLREALLGALFAVVVILLFLRNFKTTLIAVVSIPISILTAIILLNRFGVTLNIMTLGGLAVATGRVVDDSIVVIENIYRVWKTGLGYGKQLVLYGTQEVGKAILTSTLTTIAVFVPLGMVSGMVGKIFFPFALTVVVSLVSSLLVALTIVPMLAWLFVVRSRRPEFSYDWADTGGVPTSALDSTTEAHEGMTLGDGDEGAIHPDFVRGLTSGHRGLPPSSHDETTGSDALRPWQRKYQSGLTWFLNHKVIVLLFTAAAFAASVMVLPLVGSTFIPNSSEQFATVSLNLPVGTPLAVTNAKAKQIEALLRTDEPSVTQVNTQVGQGSGRSLISTPQTNIATLFIQFSATADLNQVVDKIRSQVEPLVNTNTNIQVKLLTMGGAGTSFDVVVTGTNPAAIQSATQMVVQKLGTVTGLANVQSNLTQTQPEVSVVPDRARSSTYGLTPGQIYNFVHSYLSAQNIGTVTLNGLSYDLNVNLTNGSNMDTVSALRQLPITTQTGQTITLGQVASVSMVQTQTSVLHQNGQPFSEITADYTTQNTGATLKTAMTAIHSLALPSGVQVQQSSASQQQNQSFSQLIEAILVAAGMVYIVMLIAFGGWSAPFAILFSMPVALIGAFFGTVIGHQPISVSSLIGILMLMGIVVTNAIVLVTRVEQKRAAGLSVREALLEAGTTRLRPILMTAIATIFALLPLALGYSEGMLISQGLAVVVIGGIVSSTVLTLGIVPLVYELLNLRTHRREQKAQLTTGVFVQS